jgi:hypothetical protein
MLIFIVPNGAGFMILGTIPPFVYWGIMIDELGMPFLTNQYFTTVRVLKIV